MKKKYVENVDIKEKSFESEKKGWKKKKNVDEKKIIAPKILFWTDPSKRMLLIERDFFPQRFNIHFSEI